MSCYPNGVFGFLPGQWTPWSVWNECSVTCSHHTGVQSRSRECPGNADDYCTGPAHQLKQCHSTNKCQGLEHYILI